MTLDTTDFLPLPTEVAGTYRARDIDMAATVDVDNRLILLTGAIDSNDHTIVVRVELPSAGRWQIIKAETNLTSTAWDSWQIGLGEGTTLCVDEESKNLCRQFAELHVAKDRERFVFHRGTIRPGESILKMFTLDTLVPRIVMAHTRGLEEADIDNADAPSTQDSRSLASRIKDGFPLQAHIEAFVPVTLV